MSRLQKILLIVAFVVVTILIGFLIFVIFFRPFIPSENVNVNAAPETGEQINLSTGASGRLPSINSDVNAAASAPPTSPPSSASQIASGGLTQTSLLTQYEVYMPTLSTDGNYIIYYDPDTQKFYKISPSGQSSLLSDKNFYQVENIIWAPNKTKAVIEYPDGANIIYDFVSNIQVTLPKHWQDFSFSPQSDKITAKSIGLDAENRFLITANADGSKIKVVANLGENADKVIADWSPNNLMVGELVGDLDLDRQEIYFIGQNDENYKSMVVEGWGFSGRWSPQGDKIVYSVYNAASDDKPTLWISDATPDTIGRNRLELRLNTWADKCAFYDNNTLYCAVPTSLEAGAGLFPNELDNSPDVIYKINLTTGNKSLIASPETNNTISDLMVSPDGKYLYYTDKFDGRLYDIRLK